MATIKSRKEFEAVKRKIESLIKKGNSTGGLDNLSDTDSNDLMRLSQSVEQYEKIVLKLDTIKGRSSVILRIDEEMFNRGMTQKQYAGLLDISEAQLSDIINNRTPISMKLAIKLHKSGIDGNFIIEHNEYLLRAKHDKHSIKKPA